MFEKTKENVKEAQLKTLWELILLGPAKLWLKCLVSRFLSDFKICSYS